MKSNQIQIIQRPPFDEFTYELFCELVNQLPGKFEAYYTWTNPPSDFLEFVTTTKFEQPTVVIAIKDMLDMWHEYNYWNDSQTAGAALLSHVAQQYPNTKFIIFTSLENLHLEVTDGNIQIVAWGGDVTNQAGLYTDIQPVLNKNFDSDKTFISLNRNARDHRVVLLSYLFGTDLAEHGYISFLQQDTKDPIEFLDRISWNFDSKHDTVKEIMIAGFNKFYRNTELVRDDYIIYPEEDNNNVKNFNTNLRSNYENSFIEFITESSFSAPSYMITEKTLNSVYACNFPIMICGQGIVAHLRELGFDTFDDIIDHSYDTIANPFDRIIAAVDLNKELLYNNKLIKQLWIESEYRFVENIEVAKNVYTWYNKRARKQFANILEQFQSRDGEGVSRGSHKP